MKSFELRLRDLASQLGIRLNSGGFPIPHINPSTHGVGIMALACWIETSLRFEDMDERRQNLTELAKSIDEWSEILGKNDHRVQILWAMHAIASAIVDGRRVPTAEELGFT